MSECERRYRGKRCHRQATHLVTIKRHSAVPESDQLCCERCGNALVRFFGRRARMRRIAEVVA